MPTTGLKKGMGVIRPPPPLHRSRLHQAAEFYSTQRFKCLKLPKLMPLGQMGQLLFLPCGRCHGTRGNVMANPVSLKHAIPAACSENGHLTRYRGWVPRYGYWP